MSTLARPSRSCAIFGHRRSRAGVSRGYAESRAGGDRRLATVGADKPTRKIGSTKRFEAAAVEEDRTIKSEAASAPHQGRSKGSDNPSGHPGRASGDA
jgi:hypothetical protein